MRADLIEARGGVAAAPGDWKLRLGLHQFWRARGDALGAELDATATYAFQEELEVVANYSFIEPTGEVRGVADAHPLRVHDGQARLRLRRGIYF